MVCSTKGIMRFENMEDENVNGNIHFHLPMVKDRLLLKDILLQKAGWLYLQRYVKFDYTTKRVSPTERHYFVSQWDASASSIDESQTLF